MKTDVQNLIIQDYANKIELWDRVLLFVAKFWWVVGAAILYMILSAIQSNPYVQCVSFAPLIIHLIGVVLDKAIDDAGSRFMLYKWVLDSVKSRYVKKLEQKISNLNGDADKEAIIKACLEHSDIQQVVDRSTLRFMCFENLFIPLPFSAPSLCPPAILCGSSVVKGHHDPLYHKLVLSTLIKQRV